MKHAQGNEKCIQHFVRKTKARYHLEDLGLDGKVILKLVLARLGVDLIQVAEDRE
jgi:hypothetical protein